MAKIEQYTKGITVPRAVPRLDDPNAIKNASAMANSISDIADIGFKIADAHERANETTALNDLNIEYQKEAMTYLDKARKDNSENPFGFAKKVDGDLFKIADNYAKRLPSERARKAWNESIKQQNFGYYKQNFTWENTKSAQVYAERTERAARNINDMAYLAGKNAGSVDEVMKNVGATVVSVSTYQPDKNVLSEVNSKMSSGAIMSYIKGRAESDPIGAFQILQDGKYDKKIGQEKADQLRKSLAQQSADSLADDNPSAAIDFVRSDSFKKIVGDKKAEQWDKTIQRKIESQKVFSASVQAANGADMMLKAARGEITAVDIQEDSALSPEDRYISMGLLTGDEAAIIDFAKTAGLAKGGFEEVNSFSLLESLTNATDQFNAGKKDNKSYQEYINKINAIKATAAAARQHNASNRGSGLNQTDFNSVMKKAAETLTTAGDQIEESAPGMISSIFSSPTGFDRLYDEVKSISSDNKIRAELLGYATNIAESKKINLFEKMTVTDADNALKPVIEELYANRKRQLGIKPSAPRVNKFIKDGVVILNDPSYIPPGSIVIDRTVNTPKPSQEEINYLGIR